jgi:hypothetical protein
MIRELSGLYDICWMPDTNVQLLNDAHSEVARCRVLVKGVEEINTRLTAERDLWKRSLEEQRRTIQVLAEEKQTLNESSLNSERSTTNYFSVSVNWRLTDCVNSTRPVSHTSKHYDRDALHRPTATFQKTLNNLARFHGRHMRDS